jgi:hypothetical protein
MALKGWIDAGKCLLGLHQGDWKLEAPSRCVWLQTCESCGAVSQRLEHSWSDWTYASEHRCDLSRRCSRCAESEASTEHQWGAWTYRQEGSCNQGVRCERCLAWADEKRTEHLWSPWDYSEHYRAPLRSCSRCGLRASYFADQTIDEEDESSAARNPAMADIGELIADDNAIEAMLARAEQSRASETRSSEPGPSDDDNSKWQPQLALIRQLYEGLSASGQIASERRPLLSSILSELEQTLRDPTPTLADKQIKARRIQDMFLRMREVLINPSRVQPVERPSAGSRLAAIVELHENLHRYVITETAGALLTGEEGKAVTMLLGRLAQTREALANLPADADPVKLESESLRQLALDIRNFSLRHHLTVAKPVWPSQTVVQHPDAVFYSGGSTIGELLGRVCESRGLRRLIPQLHREPASLRWDQLREGAVAVFDFTAYKRSAPLEDASAVAAVAYELGIAFALGRSAIIVANENQDLPFDLDIEPIRLGNGDADAAALSVALDRALYGLQRGGAGSSVEPSVRYLRDRFGTHGDFHVRLSLDNLDAEAARDPIKARLLIASAFGFLGAEAPQIISPAWPGIYPDRSSKRCFHVTPFGPSWSNSTMRLVKEACSALIEYVRGDQVLAPDIVRSIWDEICRATYVVVDLTGLNANVALELGIAHTLGRNVLLVSQDQQPERYFRAVAKYRIHPYALDSAPDISAFKAKLEKFFGYPLPPSRSND